MSEAYPHDEAFERAAEAWEAIAIISDTRILPATREELMTHIETPLQEAVGILYDRNIQTLWSSANFSDFFHGAAQISLDWETLSEANRQILTAYPHHELTTIEGLDVKIAGLYIPIDPEDTPLTTQQRAAALAQQFEIQPFSWAPTWSMAEARTSIAVDGINLLNIDEDELGQRLIQAGYYFDTTSDRFYMSEEHFQKVAAAPKQQ